MILSIETSCDETAVAILKDGVVLSSVIASQIKWHKRFGGVVPELASRMHAEKIHGIIQDSLNEASVSLDQLDSIAVTYGPGLEGALLVGIAAAKTLGMALQKPVIPINHLHGHIYSAFIDAKETFQFPCICLLVSGGHTMLVHLKDHFDFELLGSTRDDACGEAFDKVARVMGLSYPGGPIIEKIALEGDASRYDFPRAMKHSPYEFSFSGLKTAVSQLCQSLGDDLELEKAHVAASFQAAVSDTLVSKAVKACEDFNVSQLLVCGGVMANRVLATDFQAQCDVKGLSLLVPPLAYCTDNAAMIGMAAHHYMQRFEIPNSFYVTPQLSVESL